jgi:hypothetical protein
MLATPFVPIQKLERLHSFSEDHQSWFLRDLPGLLLARPHGHGEEHRCWRNASFNEAHNEAESEEAREVEDCGLQHADNSPYKTHISKDSANGESLENHICRISTKHRTEVLCRCYPRVVVTRHLCIGLETISVGIVQAAYD